MKTRPFSDFRSATSGGFSLIELLVATVVLLIMVVLISAVVGMVSGVWQQGRAKADNYAKARLSLDVLARDFQNGILDGSLPAFRDENGAAPMFYAKRSGISSVGGPTDRPLALIAYRVQAVDGLDPKEVGLQRAARGFAYGDVPSDPVVPPAVPSETNAFQTIGPGVLLFGVQLLQRDGRRVEIGEFRAPSAGESDETVAVVVSIVVVDEITLESLTRAGRVGQVVADLGVSTASGGFYSQSHHAHWRERIENGSAFDGLPGAARSGVRVFERTVPLQPLTL
jgi:type II secretory pathway pseudopilin PulG